MQYYADYYPPAAETFGQRYADASFRDLLLDEKNSTKISDWIKKDTNFLIYTGNPGIGKTYFCAAFYNFLKDTKRMKTFRYWNERQLLTKLREAIDTDHEYLQVLSLCIDDHYVLLDDLGSSGVNEWRKEVMFEFLDQRYASQLPTIITSNFTEEEIKINYGSRFHSRMFEKGTTIISSKNHDLRAPEKPPESKTVD